MNIEQKKRLRSIIIKSSVVLTVGMLYAAFSMITGIAIPCIFYLITHKYCPGCGISRMFISLLKLDFVSAARYNILVLSLLPFAAALFLYKSAIYVKRGDTTMGKTESILYCLAFIMCIAFYFLRNSGAISFLTMP